MINLILDDVRDATQCFHVTGNQMYLQLDWVVVKTYDEFVYYIQTHPLPDRISYDNDLCHEHYLEGAYYEYKFFNYDKVLEKTGYHACLWMIDQCIEHKIQMPESYAHSMNPYGKMKIESAIKQYTKHFYLGDFNQ